MTGAEPTGLDEPALHDWFRSLGLDVTGSLKLTRIGLGQSNLTFLVRDEEGRRWVLRRPPLGRLLASAHDVAREAGILSALEHTGVPVPEVYGVYREGAAPLVLMEFVDGLVIDRLPDVEEVSAQARHAIGLSLAGTLATVHAVDLGRTGLADLASHRPYAPRQLKRWSLQWQKSRTRELPELDRLTERLTAAVPEQRELSLVHGDYHLRNVITSPGVGTVTSVLDWELSTLGDPMADLGTLLAYWPEPGETAVAGSPASACPGFPSRAELVEAYAEQAGRDPATVGFWHALGLWKIAIIAEGVLRRALDEPRNRAAEGTPTASLIEALVARAAEVAADAGL
ncbi:phosphotransferase family protein [Spirillospora sp. CA-108201]